MDSARAAHALATASSLLVNDHDVLGSLAALFDSCRDVLSIDSAAVVVEHDGGLQLLAASSHSTEQLEMHQTQFGEGPCVDAFHEDAVIQVASYEQMHRRWPVVGPLVTAAGFRSLHATPLRWHGTTIGAMGLFRRAARAFTAEEDNFARTFADVATLVIMSADSFEVDSLSQRVEQALSSRVLIEQAKGVLAETRHLTMAEAYDHLTTLAAEDGSALLRVADRIVTAAIRPPGDGARG